MDWRATLCSGCSQPVAESFNPDGPEYEAKALRCRACEARDLEAESFRKDDNADMSGLYFVVNEAE